MLRSMHQRSRAKQFWQGCKGLHKAAGLQVVPGMSWAQGGAAQGRTTAMISRETRPHSVMPMYSTAGGGLAVQEGWLGQGGSGCA